MYVQFQNVLRVSLFITPVILLLVFLMPRLGRRYAPRLRCLIWMLLTLRLLIPLNYSLRGIPFAFTPVSNLLNQIDQSAVVDALKGLLSDESGTMPLVAGQAVNIPTINWSLWATVWFVGVILFLCSNIIAYHMTVKRLQRWSVPVTNQFTLKTFKRVKGQLSISRGIELYITAKATTPMLVGFIHPRIYLPNRQLSASELSNVLSHELCHFKRKDLWFKLALLLSNAIHWFNPVVYLMLYQVGLDMEMACDSDVLRNASPSACRKYGLTILSFVEKAQAVPTPLTTYFYGGNKQMNLRFSDMINKNKKKSGIVFLAIFTFLIVFCGAWADNSVFAITNADNNEIIIKADEGSPISNNIGEFAWPVPGFYDIVSPFGWSDNKNDFHTGINISGEKIYGVSVIAADAGTISVVSEQYTVGVGYGKYIVIDHGDTISTLYGHLSAITVKPGDKIEKGQEIAHVGSTGFSTGPHLQFDVREDNVPVDPVTYLMPSEQSLDK